MLVILLLYVQFLPEVLFLFLSLYRKSWMNWTNAILCLLDEYLVPGLVLGVVFPLLSADGKRFFWSLEGTFFWHLIRLLIFSSQRLRNELIILDEYWFTKIKLALGCPRKGRTSLELTNNNGIPFPFKTIMYRLFRWIFRTWSGSGIVTFARSGWPCDAVCCFVWSPFPGCRSIFLHIPLSKIYNDLLSAFS